MHVSNETVSFYKSLNFVNLEVLCNFTLKSPFYIACSTNLCAFNGFNRDKCPNTKDEHSILLWKIKHKCLRIY
jgi:hypothetical protein